ncbi:hypothetical protein HD806DRAFT_544353 [Xylariaceae sp. AK1471]|nr:hypothetical protein HD806DRAFT_544353 [Xylariaceae sp. AK1471]
MATPIPNTMLGTQNEQPQSPLLAMLPVEMILNIADQTTSAADAVSLALTCRSLFFILSKYTFKRLEAHSREMLLMNLERDISSVVYCPVARRLLSFHSIFKENSFYYPEALKSGQSFNTAGSLVTSSIWLGKSSYISFLETRLVRNRRLFGSTHGIPLSCLSLTGIQFSSCLFMQTKCRMFLDISRTAKWIGENLFLSSTWIVHVMGAKIAVIASKCYGVLYPSFYEAGARLSKNSAYEGMGACSVCETDWDVSISWSKRSLVFKLVKYHDLGCCSIPPDPKWLRLLNYRRYQTTKSSPRETCHGYVRHKWINSG